MKRYVGDIVPLVRRTIRHSSCYKIVVVDYKAVIVPWVFRRGKCRLVRTHNFECVCINSVEFELLGQSKHLGAVVEKAGSL